jgi:hypothetical protein
VTKKIHNGLQGAGDDLTETEREAYLGTSRRNAELLTEEYDFVFLHDPQPAGILSLRANGSARAGRSSRQSIAIRCAGCRLAWTGLRQRPGSQT